jgi:phenylacetic acid degradation operon negative regulatory protein
MKPKTEELLYLLLWTCDMLARPTFRNLTDSFEVWAYRNGLQQQLARLEQRQFLETAPEAREAPVRDRALRLTEAGRLHALGGRDPEARWRRVWDGLWRLVLFDLPNSQARLRDRLRSHLRRRGWGWLQNSVWICPDPLEEEKTALAGTEVNVESLILLEARPGAGETDQEIVAGAWDFERINRLYAQHGKVLAARPAQALADEAAARGFRKWLLAERQAWLAVVAEDPLLPASLLPPGYAGREAWLRRKKAMTSASAQLCRFQVGR